MANQCMEEAVQLFMALILEATKVEVTAKASGATKGGTRAARGLEQGWGSPPSIGHILVSFRRARGRQKEGLGAPLWCQ